MNGIDGVSAATGFYFCLLVGGIVCLVVTIVEEVSMRRRRKDK